MHGEVVNMIGYVTISLTIYGGTSTILSPDVTASSNFRWQELSLIVTPLDVIASQYRAPMVSSQPMISVPDGIASYMASVDDAIRS